MNTTIFTRMVFSATVLATITTFFIPAEHVQSAHAHITIEPAKPSDTPGKIEVLEFFAYTCQHCSAIESLLENWKKKAPDDVVVKRIPIAFNVNMRPLQQLYYSLLALDRTDLHAQVFAAIHTEKRILFEKKAIIEWAIAQGVEKEKFEAVFDSFSVSTQVKRANQLAQAYRVDSIPVLAIGGKFITTPELAGNSYEGALDEVEKLISILRSK